MPRRHQQRRRALRLAERVQDPGRGTYRPIDRELCTEKVIHSPWGDGYEFRIELRIWRHAGRTVDFAYVIQCRRWDHWENLGRIDCRNHGSCHVHAVDDGPPTEHLMRLDSVDDLGEAMRRSQLRARQMIAEIAGEGTT